MGIDRAHYHPWQGRLRSPWWSCLAITRVGVLQVVRRKLYWIAIGLGLLWFLTYFVAIYLATQFGSFRDMILERIHFTAVPDPDADNGYLMFIEQQSIIVIILLALSGSLLVGADFRLKALPFYLSRRIDRRHYIVGKALAISALICLLTVVPALVLFLEYGAFTTSYEYWLENWRIVVSVLGYGLVLCVVLSTWLMALSAYLQKVAPIAITWCSLFLLPMGLRSLLVSWTDNRGWNLIDPWRNIRYVGRYFFGTFPRPEDAEFAAYAAAILGAATVAALWLVVRRVRAVDVVA